jgi:hypothetical protein
MIGRPVERCQWEKQRPGGTYGGIVPIITANRRIDRVFDRFDPIGYH